MASETPIPLDYLPGVVTKTSPLSSNRRFVDCSWVRFWRGKAQKVGGYIALFKNTGQALGTPRGATFWSDSIDRQLIAYGTEIKLYWFSSVDWAPNDMTPWRVSATKTDPITTQAGSTEVKITYTSHGATAGDYVDISGAADVDNFSPNGSWIVKSVFSANVVIIDAPQAAINSVTGGGASVKIGFEISPGSANPSSGYGWGAGTWGTGTWGTPRTTASISFDIRYWTLDSFGKILIACPNRGAIYAFDPSATPPARATYIATAPTCCTGVVVTSDLIVLAYGSSYDPNTALDGGPTKQDPMQWWASAQGDYTNWDTVAIAGPNGTPSVVGSLAQGSRIVGALDLGIHATLVWTDTALYQFQYTGSQYVFNITLAGKECGLIGPLAAVTVGTSAFWMGPNGFFMYNGGVQRIPNHQDISEWVLTQLRPYYTLKTTAWFNQEFNEVWFGFVINNEEEPTYYVAVNLDEWTWTKGRFPEAMSSGTHYVGFSATPVVVGSDGDIYQLDTGVDAEGEPAPWSLTWGAYELDAGANAQEIAGLAMDMERQVGTIVATITTYDRSPAGETVLDTMTQTLDPATNLQDFRVSGRQVTMTWEGGYELGDDFRLGHPKLLTNKGGARR